MQNFILSTIPLSELQEAISAAVKKEITPLVNSIASNKQVPELLTRKQVGSLLGVSLPTILDWTNSGKITGYRIGSRVRYKLAEIEQSLSQISQTT